MGSQTGNRGGDVIAASVATAIIALIAASLRIWSRILLKKAGLWWDDWTVLASIPFVLGNLSLTLYWVHIGLGKHLKPVLAKGGSVREHLIVLFADGFLYAISITLVKLSAILFYMRVFKQIIWYRRILWAAVTLVVAWLVEFVFVATFTCIPVHKQWDKQLSGHCLMPASTYIGTAVPNVLIDLIILLLPMPMLWRLEISNSRKVALSGVFALGYCVMIISIVRLVTTVRFQKKGFEDFTFDFVPLHILVVIEPPLAILSVSLPSIFKLVNRGIRHGMTSLFTTGDPSETARAPWATGVDKTAGDRGHHGFAKLDAKTSHDTLADRLIHNQASAAGDSVTSNPEPEIPLHQIQVRRDIDVVGDTAGRLA